MSSGFDDQSYEDLEAIIYDLRTEIARLRGAALNARETLIELGFTEGNAVIFDLDNALKDKP